MVVWSLTTPRRAGGRGRAAEALGLIGSRRALDALRARANDNALTGHLGAVGEIVQAAIEEIEKKTRRK